MKAAFVATPQTNAALRHNHADRAIFAGINDTYVAHSRFAYLLANSDWQQCVPRLNETTMLNNYCPRLTPA